jgi:NAD(P)-dependent dehydrogenase (short-subunit alcohol dehydrogenase family)
VTAQVLEGQVAIVTGGNRNIGFGLALALGRAGATVAIANRDSESGERAAAKLQQEGVHCFSIPANVSVTAEVDSMVQEVLDRWGRIDILVNNAAVRVDKTASNHTAADWDWIMAINVKGVWECSRAVYPAMKRQSYGRIINIGSISARKGVYRRVSYSATKAAVSGLTRGLAVEWAADGITVNTVSPGSVATPERPPDKSSIKYQANMDLIPLGRQATPEDIAALVLLLASPEAEYITGQDYLVDGGWCLTMRPMSNP